jgi:hypothetical protein
MIRMTSKSIQFMEMAIMLQTGLMILGLITATAAQKGNKDVKRSK